MHASQLALEGPVLQRRLLCTAVQVQLLLQKIRELGVPSGEDQRISVKYGLLFRCANVEMCPAHISIITDVEVL